MANVKALSLAFVLDFDFGSMSVAMSGGDTVAHRTAVSNIKAALYDLGVDPTTGTSLVTEDAGMRPNEHGGMASRVRFVITGREAFSFGFLDQVRGDIKRLAAAHPVIEKWDVADVEAYA